MAFPVANRKSAFLSAPRASSASGPQGQVLAVSVSATASYFSLATGVSQAVFNYTTHDNPKSLTKNFVTIESDVDLGVIFGSTAALVTGGNVPYIATVGTLLNGVYTPAPMTAWVIYAKTPQRFLLQEGADLFLGFVGASNGTMRLYQSSNDDA